MQCMPQRVLQGRLRSVLDARQAVLYRRSVSNPRRAALQQCGSILFHSPSPFFAIMLPVGCRTLIALEW